MVLFGQNIKDILPEDLVRSPWFPVVVLGGALVAFLSLNSMYLLGFLYRMDPRIRLFLDGGFYAKLVFDLGVSITASLFFSRIFIIFTRFIVYFFISMPVMIFDTLKFLSFGFFGDGASFRKNNYKILYITDVFLKNSFLFKTFSFILIFTFVHFSFFSALIFMINVSWAVFSSYLAVMGLAYVNDVSRRYASGENYKIKIHNYFFPKKGGWKDQVSFFVMSSALIMFIAGWQEVTQRSERSELVYLDGRPIYLIIFTGNGIIYTKDKPVFNAFGDISYVYEEWSYQYLDSETVLRADWFPSVDD